MKHFLAISLIVICLSTVVQPVHAQEDSSPSATETTRQLKERIQRIVEEKKDQIKGAIDELSQQKSGFIGEVERVTAESITINNRKGTRIIPLDEQVTLLRSNDEIEVEEIAVGDWVVVMGIEENDAFVPIRILVTSESLRPQNHVVELGSITDSTRNTVTILTRKGREITGDVTNNTNYQDNDGDEAQASDFIDDLQVLLVGYEDDDGITITTIRALASLSDLQDDE